MLDKSKKCARRLISNNHAYYVVKRLITKHYDLLPTSSLSSVWSSKFLSDKWPCDSLTNFIKSLLIRRVFGMHVSSGDRKVFPLVTTWLATEFTLSQKLDTNYTPIEPLESATILGRHLCFFLVGSDFIMLCSNFPMSAFNKRSRLSINSFSMSNSGNYFAQLMPLAKSLQF